MLRNCLDCDQALVFPETTAKVNPVPHPDPRQAPERTHLLHAHARKFVNRYSRFDEKTKSPEKEVLPVWYFSSSWRPVSSQETLFVLTTVWPRGRGVTQPLWRSGSPWAVSGGLRAGSWPHSSHRPLPDLPSPWPRGPGGGLKRPWEFGYHYPALI